MNDRSIIQHMAMWENPYTLALNRWCGNMLNVGISHTAELCNATIIHTFCFVLQGFD